jgi:hypothetical protein
MACHTPVARLIAAVKVDEQEHEDELNEQNHHPAPAAEPIPKFSDCHMRNRIPQGKSQNKRKLDRADPVSRRPKGVNDIHPGRADCGKHAADETYDHGEDQ